MTGRSERLLDEIAGEPALLEPQHLRRRLELLDRLDAHFPDPALPHPLSDPARAKLHPRAAALRARLEDANHALYQSLRDEIQRGQRPHLFLRLAGGCADQGGAPASGPGFDWLDDLIAGVFQFADPQSPPHPAHAEMVAYQPTPARAIFHLIALAALSPREVLVDLGSGLGHVPLLVSVCTGAQSIGIELQAAYVQSARQSAARLHIANVTFIRQDARQADLSAGTVFYLHTPFKGETLQQMLTRLRQQAALRSIRICAFGPCVPAVAAERWLEARSSPAAGRVTLFQSR